MHSQRSPRLACAAASRMQRIRVSLAVVLIALFLLLLRHARKRLPRLHSLLLAAQKQEQAKITSLQVAPASTHTPHADSGASRDDEDMVRLQVSITKLKLRNLPPRTVPSSIASFARKLVGVAIPPNGLSISLRWGNGPPMRTAALAYPAEKHEPTLFADDRFAFEYVTDRSALQSEALQLTVCGASLEGSGTAQRAADGANEDGGLHPADEEPAVLGHVELPLMDLARGPTRNDHPLRGAPQRFDPCSTELGSPPAGPLASGTPTGSRLAFRCRVSELRKWRVQLESVKLHLKPDVLDALVQNSYKVTDLAAEAQVSHSSKQCRN